MDSLAFADSEPLVSDALFSNPEPIEPVEVPHGPSLSDLRRAAFQGASPACEDRLAGLARSRDEVAGWCLASTGPAPAPTPFQRGIAEAIGDESLNRVTVVKSVRQGYSTLLVGAVAHYARNDPSPSFCCCLPNRIAATSQPAYWSRLRKRRHVLPACSPMNRSMVGIRCCRNCFRAAIC